MKQTQHKFIVILVFSAITLIYIYTWFKQYTYFFYSGAEEDIFDEKLAAIAADAAEKEFEQDPVYNIKLSRIIIWAQKYSDISISNESENTIRITVSDYYGGDVEAMNKPVNLLVGESCGFVADGRNGYVLTVYGEYEDQKIDGVHVSHSNAAYMNRWKIATLVLLCCVTVVTALSVVGVFVNGNKYQIIAPYFYLALGVLCFIYMEYSRLKGLEDWNYTIPQMGAVYAAVMIILSSAGFETDRKVANQQKIKWPIFWGVISMLIAFLIQYLMLTSRPGTVLYAFNGSLESKRRILGYAVVVILFLLIYLALGHKKVSQRIQKSLEVVFSGKFVLPAMILLALATGEKWICTNPISLFLTVLLIACFKYVRKIHIRSVIYGIFTAVITIIVALNRCVINIWDTGAWGDTYHASSFYNSLLPVAENRPFESGMNELYGHYALFYKISMLIFGNNMRTVGITTAFFSGITVLAALLAFRKLIKNDILRIIAGLILAVTMISDELYVMTFPLRELWSFVLLAYCAYTQQIWGNRHVKWGGYLICTLAVLWNPESGVVCLICWSLYAVIRNQEQVDVKQSVLLLLKECGYIVGTVLIAYLLVKAYNIVMAPGTNVWQELTDWHKELGIVAKYDTGDTSDGKLYWGNEAWLYIEMILFMISAVVLKRLGIFNSKKYEVKDTPEVLLLVYSIGIFAYWMNRPEEYDIIAPYIGCLLVAEADRFIVATDEREEHNKSVKYLLSFCFFFGIASMLSQVPMAIKNTVDNLTKKGIMDYASVCRYMENFEKEVPRDAYMEAIGSSMISMTLGRPLKGDARAETDPEQFIRNIEGEEWVLTGSGKTILPEGTLYKTIPFGKYAYYLYHQEVKK